MMRRAALLVLLALSGCGATADLHATCRTVHAAPWLQAELFFGRSIAAGGEVSDADWTQFVRTEITPRFPDGLTMLDGAGQWRDSTGKIGRERSKVVVIAAPAASDLGARLNAIAAAYKARFRQESVGVVLLPACAAF